MCIRDRIWEDEEAIENIKDAIKLYIESLKVHREKIPTEDIIIKKVVENGNF